jgi:hypothetical protein
MSDKKSTGGSKASDGGSQRPGIGKPENRGVTGGAKAGGTPPPKKS